MSEIASIHCYPLTGAQAVNLESAPVSAGGILHDRQFVLYEPAEGDRQPAKRVGQSHHPELARVSVSIDRNPLQNDPSVLIKIPDLSTVVRVALQDEAYADQTVDEYGDITPVKDCGDEVASYFADFLEIPSVRMGRKTPQWCWPSYEEAKRRHVRPLHIVASATIAELQRRAGTTDIAADRLRPNAVVQTDQEPFVEQQWVGKKLLIGGIHYEVTKGTARCDVPGYNQKSGDKTHEIPRLYRGIPHKNEKGKALLGVYVVPVIAGCETEYLITGQTVTVVD